MLNVSVEGFSITKNGDFAFVYVRDEYQNFETLHCIFFCCFSVLFPILATDFGPGFNIFMLNRIHLVCFYYFHCTHNTVEMSQLSLLDINLFLSFFFALLVCSKGVCCCVTFCMRPGRSQSGVLSYSSTILLSHSILSSCYSRGSIFPEWCYELSSSLPLSLLLRSTF